MTRRAAIIAAFLALGLFLGIAGARAERPVTRGTITESVTVVTVTVDEPEATSGR